jgi:8-hydroxy-5-deazaflavin:NADPH oxidoreductase
MKVGVLGSGAVGQTIAARLVEVGHEVTLGTRDVAALLARTEPGMGQSESFAAWHRQHPQVALGTFAETAAHGEVLFNCTAGGSSLAALDGAGAGRLGSKILIDVANTLDFSAGFPPSLSVVNTDSLGEQIQRAFPEVRVVKALNTVTAAVMVDPGRVAGGDHSIFVCGEDAAARAEVAGYLRQWFGWREVIDLGGISAARGTEMYLPLWLQLMGALGTPAFNIKVVR